ncbi:hypothetical protein B0H13DRAFT_2324486 [Mycena leptocephala]|nr:hypothetical protein B0H13DRAFT_2324486 [Mycena leptocephala]
MLGWNPSYWLCIAAIVLQTLADGTANPQEARSRPTISKRIYNNTFHLNERAQFVNQEFTWTAAGTPDVCTGKIYQDSDFYVAMASDQFGDGSNCCGKQMTITVNGTTTNATCVDRCVTCTSFGLDFTKGLFEYFAGDNLEVGVIHGSWSFIDVSGGGNNSTISRSSSTSAHLASQTATAIQKSARNATRAAVIAGTVSASVGLLAGVVILFLCVRRRRQRIAQHLLLPEHFTKAEEHVSQDDLRLKAESLRAQPVAVVAENDVFPYTNAEDGAETVTLRLRRVEAQLETLLTMGLPEGSPPSYAG